MKRNGSGGGDEFEGVGAGANSQTHAAPTPIPTASTTPVSTRKRAARATIFRIASILRASWLEGAAPQVPPPRSLNRGCHRFEQSQTVARPGSLTRERGLGTGRQRVAAPCVARHIPAGACRVCR